MTVSAEIRPSGPVVQDARPRRVESRQRVVHVVEYARFPRRRPGEARRVAYTQDRSPTGLGLELREALEPGELLQVTVRDIDGDVSIDGLARVVWASDLEDGRARAGLAMLRGEGERPMLRVRRRGLIARRPHILDHAPSPGRAR